MRRRCRGRACILALAAVWAAAAHPARAQDSSPTDGYPRPAGVDVIHYDIRVRVPEQGRSIDGRTAILFEVASPAPEAVTLDFGRLQVDSVHVDGKPARFSHSGDRLRIPLGGLVGGARVEAVVWYHGEPADGLFLQASRHGGRAVFADNWPNRAHHWFPGVDHPSDKATVDLQVEAPAEMDVVANGYLREVVDLGRRRERTRWSMTEEIPTYCMVIGATDFAIERAGVVNGVEISHWSFPEDSAAASAAFARSPEIVAFYDSLFGPFPYEKLANVQSSTRFGGMENASAIFYDEKRVAQAGKPGAVRSTGAATADTSAAAASGAVDPDGSLTDLAAHETAHQWFGDAVTEADWHHLWLSEGFATYSAALFFEFRGGSEGRGPGELSRRMAGMREEVVAYEKEAREPVLNLAEKDYFRLLNPNNYEKGAWVLHMLRGLIGDEAFFEGLRDYYATFRDHTAWTADFRRVMEQASGMELDRFFEQWLERPGHPVLQLRHGRGAGGETRVKVRQVQDGPPFRFPLDLELVWRGGSRRERVDVDEKEESYTFRTPGPVRSLRMDPDARLLYTPEK